ncbi:hypothetical protein AGLY_018076 [Aphis glycines]|uniref:Uncharacterized protein n=1 Tax=Aphis glycines TaxID=307491 RepID=A0A6G0ST03_APHGL|nr:hypothetical protein AGLY_018076 [Aphis glycines]
MYFNSRSSFLKSLKNIPTKDNNANPSRQSQRKKVKPVYYNDHNKVLNWLNSTQNEFQSNLYLNNISDTGYNNDENILERTYNINTEFCSNLGLESEIHINNDHEMFNETSYTELIPLVFSLESNNDPYIESIYEINIPDDNNIFICEEQPAVFNLEQPTVSANLENNNGPDSKSIYEIDIHDLPKKKNRIEQKYLRDHGQECINRKGVIIPQKKFKELVNCCRKKCDVVCSPEVQKLIFEGFYKLEKNVQYQILYSGITLSDKKTTRLGRVCKKMFQSVYGIIRGKIDLIIQQMKMSDSGTLHHTDNRGRHEPHNKMVQEKIDMRNHIEKFQLYAKKEDKIKALASSNMRVLVFDLEQVLDTPVLSTNVSFYKRLLSTFNLTIRDCSEDGGTECYMWHEAIGERGSNDIASCLYQKIINLPSNVTHVITYSDTCGGQNRNINMAAILSLITSKSSTLQIIDQKFLLPGHTHLECDVDHAKIERAKKFSDIPIMVPRDWYQFVKSVRGQKPFKVIEMNQQHFFSFSNLVSTTLIKKNIDTDGNKYRLNQDEPFRTLDLKRGKRGRPKNTSSTELNNCYTDPLPINPKKKQDLLSLLPLIHEDCHAFYRQLKTSKDAAELTLCSDSSSDE